MLRHTLGLLIAVASSLSSTGVRAVELREKFVVLVQIEEPAPAGWANGLQHAARKAAKKLVNKRWLPPPQVSIPEMRSLLGCGELDAGCVAKIGETLEVDHVLYIELDHAGQPQPKLTMFNVPVRNPAAANTLRCHLPDLGADGLAAAKAFVSGMVAEQTVTILMVASEPAGAAVELDGRPLGQTPLMLSSGVSPGRHTLHVQKSGRESVDRLIEVTEGVVNQVKVPLPEAAATVLIANQGDGQPPPAGDTPEGAPYPHWDSALAWSALAVGGIGLLAGGALLTTWNVVFEPYKQEIEQDIKDNGQVDNFDRAFVISQRQAGLIVLIANYVSWGVGAAIALGSVAFFLLPTPADEVAEAPAQP